MQPITIQYGVDRIVKTYTEQPTFRDIVEDENLQAVLGHGDNVKPLIAGIEQDLDSYVPSGSTVQLETKANTKGSPA
jgi:hypothetical protein